MADTSTHHQLVQNPMHLKLIRLWSYNIVWHLIHVEDKVKLTHIFETLVQCLNKYLGRGKFVIGHDHSLRSSLADLYQIKDAKFRLAAVHTENEVESCVVAIDQLVVRAS